MAYRIQMIICILVRLIQLIIHAQHICGCNVIQCTRFTICTRLLGMTKNGSTPIVPLRFLKPRATTGIRSSTNSFRQNNFSNKHHKNEKKNSQRDFCDLGFWFQTELSQVFTWRILDDHRYIADKAIECIPKYISQSLHFANNI